MQNEKVPDELIKMILVLSIIAIIVGLFFFGCVAKAGVENDFGLINLYDRATNDQGKGVKELYGTRNFRVVLRGTLYRSGGNNTYLPVPRDNQNPLPQVGLDNLCKAGFQTAVYNYTTNFDEAQKSFICMKNSMRYVHIDPKYKARELLELVKWHIDYNKVMLDHCLNGHHASGLASAYALMQFCSWNNANALQYWIKNTDGDSDGYDSIKKRILDFVPYPDLNISTEKQSKICFQE